MPKQVLRKNNSGNKRRVKGTRGRRGGNQVGTYFGDAWSLAKRTAVGLNEIRKLINVEHKYNDRNNSLTASQAGAVQLLTNIAQGDDVTQRDGDSIKVQSTRIQGYIRRDSGSTSSEVCRVLLIRDLMNTGTTIAGSDIIQSAGGVYSPVSTYNFINGNQLQNRFTILYDEVFTVDANNPMALFSYESKHDYHVFFRGTGSAFTDAAAGAVFLMVLTDASVNPPIATFSTRILFTDN